MTTRIGRKPIKPRTVGFWIRSRSWVSTGDVSPWPIASGSTPMDSASDVLPWPSASWKSCFGSGFGSKISPAAFRRRTRYSSHSMPNVNVRAAPMRPAIGAAYVVVPKYFVGMALCTCGLPGSAASAKVMVPSASAPGIRRLGISASLNSATAIGTMVNATTQAETPP